MELSERFGWMLLGMAIGFVFGFIVARLRSIEEKVETVDEHLKKQKRVRDDAGFMRIPVVADALYLLSLVIVLWGAYAAHQATIKVEQTNDDLRQVVVCNQEYLKSQAEFLSVLLEKPPPTEVESREALEKYFALLQAYASSDDTLTQDNEELSAYFQGCLEKGQELKETQDE